MGKGINMPYEEHPRVSSEDLEKVVSQSIKIVDMIEGVTEKIIRMSLVL